MPTAPTNDDDSDRAHPSRRVKLRRPTQTPGGTRHHFAVTGPSVPRVRRAPLPDDAILVIRGDDLDPATSRSQAQAFRRRFSDWGRWGLSAFYARNDAEVDDLGADQLERFSLLGCYRVVDLQKAGFEI
jgi:hypothetical protein